MTRELITHAAQIPFFTRRYCFAPIFCPTKRGNGHIKTLQRQLEEPVNPDGRRITSHGSCAKPVDVGLHDYIGKRCNTLLKGCGESEGDDFLNHLL